MCLCRLCSADLIFDQFPLILVLRPLQQCSYLLAPYFIYYPSICVQHISINITNRCNCFTTVSWGASHASICPLWVHRVLQGEYRRLKWKHAEAASIPMLTEAGEAGAGSAEGQQDEELLAEARALRQHKTRLETRMQILEDHNKQLESQLRRLRELLLQVAMLWRIGMVISYLLADMVAPLNTVSVIFSKVHHLVYYNLKMLRTWLWSRLQSSDLKIRFFFLIR